LPARRLFLAAVGVAFLTGAMLTLVLVDRVLRFDPQAVATGVTIAATIVTTVATVALAWFGGVQISEARRQRDSERRTADARLSATAFELRKPLADWILRSREQTWSVNLAQDAAQQTNGLLPRLAQGLADISVASPSVAEHLRTAYTYCQSASLKFDLYVGQYHHATQAQPRGADPDAYAALMADADLLSAGREHLCGCCNELECVVDPALLADAKRLGAWRSLVG
jgi:hypothetical protein